MPSAGVTSANGIQSAGTSAVNINIPVLIVHVITTASKSSILISSRCIKEYENVYALFSLLQKPADLVQCRLYVTENVKHNTS